MDPNEALNMIRRAARSAMSQMENDTDDPSFCVVDNRTVHALVDAFEALDEWLGNGGFAPTAWER